MKKLVFVAVLLALVALPAAALAQAEFKLGGYIKLDTWWDSTQVGKNLNTAVFRHNDFGVMPTTPALEVSSLSTRNHHGRFQMTAQSSRFNLTIKGPDLWGAKTSGFIEVDFDREGDVTQTSSHAYLPRLRHAFFRLDWPETQLLMGQYWGMFCNYYPELIQDGPFMFHGAATQRLPQVRLTQKFMGVLALSALVGKPYDPGAADNFGGSMVPPGTFTGPIWGQRSATPQFQISLDYEQDLWGKAAFWGRPKGFNINIAAGWQRTQYLKGRVAQGAGTAASPFTSWTFGQNHYHRLNLAGVGVDLIQRDDQYLDPWVVQATVFIPVIPTRTPNLAGTASITAQFYVGAGLSAFGMGRDQDNSYFVYRGRGIWTDPTTGITYGTPLAPVPLYERVLHKAYGGYIQAQYYFNNQWFLTYAYGFQKLFDVNNATCVGAPGPPGAFPRGYFYATMQDQVLFWQEHAVALYYRPITALKFGLQYSYMKTDWLQITTVGSRSTRFGDNHRVEFAGWFYF